MGDIRTKIGDPDRGEPGRLRFGNGSVAQETVAQHAFRKKLLEDPHLPIEWREIHVVWVNPGRGMNSWEALVRIESKPDKLYHVTYDRVSDELKVDTFSRRHVPRFY